MPPRIWYTITSYAHRRYHQRREMAAYLPELPDIYSSWLAYAGNRASRSDIFPSAALTKALDRRLNRWFEQVEAERLTRALDLLHLHRPTLWVMVRGICVKGEFRLASGEDVKHYGEAYDEWLQGRYDGDYLRLQKDLTHAWDVISLLWLPADLVAEAEAAGQLGDPRALAWARRKGLVD